MNKKHTILLVISLAAGLSTSVIGAWALMNSPSLVDTRGRLLLTKYDSNILKIAGVLVNKDFFAKIPEFLRPERESNWWLLQRSVFHAVAHQKLVPLRYKDGSETAKVQYPHYFDALGEAGIIYLVAFLVLINATLVLSKHKNRQGFVLAIAIYSSAIYILSAGVVSIRNLVLPPGSLKWLVWLSYVSSTTMLAFIYYAYIFPNNKLRGKVNIWFTSSIYTFLVVALLSYGLGIVSYGTLFPFSYLWVALMIMGFLHSLIKEKDLFLKKQLLITLLIPAITGILFTVFNVLPNSLAIPPLDFRHFAFVLLLNCFVLSTTLDHVVMYNRNKSVSINPEIVDRLTKRQREILELLIQGHSTEKAASVLNISYETVRTHLKNIYRILGVNSSLELVSLATGKFNRA